MEVKMNYKKYIREVPNFPKQGVLFYDITTILQNKEVFNKLIDDMAKEAIALKPNKISAVEARGFIFGAPLSIKLNIPFIPIRKPGKLPYKTIKMDYYLEYGKDTIEMHEDAINPNDNVLLVDDLLATGGTIQACAKLIESRDAKISGMLFAIELDFLKARTRLNNYNIKSIIHY